MKKNGWGLRTELVFILLFLMCLCVSTVLLNEANWLDNKREYISSYNNLESTLESSAKRYINEYYEGSRIDSTKYIRYSSLYNMGYIDELYDPYGKKCSGYVEVRRDDNVLIYTPYLKCDSYKTTGYSENQDW